MSSILAKIRFWKIGINVLLLALLCVILFRNSQPVEVDLLFWQAEISLVFLLIGTAILGALITFITVMIKGR